jgi:hypothetical protein
MNATTTPNAVEILLVEDDPGDARLARQGLRQCKIPNNLHIVDDGVKAMDIRGASRSRLRSRDPPAQLGIVANSA